MMYVCTNALKLLFCYISYVTLTLLLQPFKDVYDNSMF